MKRQITLKIAAVLFYIGLAVGCSKQNPGLDTYDIDYSEKISFDKDRKLLFSDVVGDNRCPIDATCITGGEAVIQFYGMHNADSVDFRLHLGPDATGPKDTLIFGDYHVELLEVLPLPLAGVEVEKADYQCRVLVEKVP